MIQARVPVGRDDDQVGVPFLGNVGDYLIWNSEVNLGAALTVSPPCPLLQLREFFGRLRAMVLQNLRHVGYHASVPDGLDHVQQQEFGVVRAHEINCVVDRFERGIQKSVGTRIRLMVIL